MGEPIRIRPFSNGSQHFDWTEANCCRCTKYRPDAMSNDPDACPIEMALSLASIDDGMISEDIARRMGFTTPTARYCWPCGEVDYTQEWKDEWSRRKGFADYAAYEAAHQQ